MSKQVTAKELAEIVTRLLTDTQTTGELDGFESFQGFMTDIAQVVCDYCGGEIHHPADSLDDIWYVGIHGNDSLPDAFGGIWREYDKEGELFTETSAAALRESGVTDYCNQVCGGGNCGGEGLCQYGIDSKTHMPPEPEASTCSECGEQVESIVGCPDGAEVCQQCFDAGQH